MPFLVSFKSNALTHDSPKDKGQVHSPLLVSVQPNCVLQYKVKCIPIQFNTSF